MSRRRNHAFWVERVGQAAAGPAVGLRYSSLAEAEAKLSSIHESQRGLFCVVEGSYTTPKGGLGVAKHLRYMVQP